MKIAKRDTVKAINGNMLHCASGVYSDAVVISVEPLVLVSRYTDMRWTCYPKEDLKVTGKASWWQYFKCVWKRGRK